MTNGAVPPSWRERNKQDKRARTFEAGVGLSDARGVAAVTTQEIADRAVMASGTLFRTTGRPKPASTGSGHSFWRFGVPRQVPPQARRERACPGNRLRIDYGTLWRKR